MSIATDALADIQESVALLIGIKDSSGIMPSERLILQVLHHIHITTEAGLAPSKRQPHRPMRATANRKRARSHDTWTSSTNLHRWSMRELERARIRDKQQAATMPDNPTVSFDFKSILGAMPIDELTELMKECLIARNSDMSDADLFELQQLVNDLAWRRI